jgi:hypothetical protein
MTLVIAPLRWGCGIAMHMFNSRVCQTNRIAVWYSPSFHFSRLRTKAKGPLTPLQQSKRKAYDNKRNAERKASGQKKVYDDERNAERKASGMQKVDSDKRKASGMQKAYDDKRYAERRATGQ